MTEQDRLRYKKRLKEKLKILTQNTKDMGEMASCSRLDASGDITNIPTHIADISADTFAQDITLGLIQNNSCLIKEIYMALDRIDKKVFGICENCHREIAKPRLDTIPHTRLCVECKMKEEEKSRGWNTPMEINWASFDEM